MKTNLKYLHRQDASALLVSLILMTVLALSIGGYLTYVQQQTVLGSRAQSFNSALAVAEAGIEEGMQALNASNYNDWAVSGNLRILTRDLGNGTGYSVTNDLSIPKIPTITSRGFVEAFNLVRNSSTLGFATVAGGGPSTLTRAIEAQATKKSLFLAGLTAKHQIRMNGKNIRTDSYNSSDPLKSSNGVYNASVYVGSHGDVASNDGIVDAVSVGNATINGDVYTGPGGSVSIGALGSVSGDTYDNANFTFPDISVTNNGGIYPPSGYVVEVVSNNLVVYETHFGETTPPSPPSPGYFLGPVTTNTLVVTTNTYPGSQPNLTTNVYWTTVSNYPGSLPGLITNCTSYKTVSSYPGSKPCLTTNCDNSITRDSSYPPAGTYCGTPWPHDWRWNYYRVTGYTYAYGFSYSYPNTNYIYDKYTYNYTIYQGVPVYETNYYDHVLSGGKYYMNSYDSGSYYVSGTSELVIMDGLDMSGGDTIKVDPAAQLTVYSGGSDLNINGNGVANLSGKPADFMVYSTATTASFSGNGTFTGILVAPYANLTMNGGGTASNPADFSGCVLANNITMNGHFSFHYDEALQDLDKDARFIVFNWKEIP